MYEVMSDNNEENNLYSTENFPLFFKELSSKLLNPEILSNSLIQTDNNQLFFDNLKNVFKEENLSFDDSVDEDNEKQMYFIKQQNNLEIESRSTDNSTNTFIEKEKYNLKKKETSNSKNIKFKTFLRKKRGKKPKCENSNISKKCHGSEDFDNIQRKIQVHFISFLVSLANDKVRQIFGKKSKYHFKDVKYELKRIVNHKNVEYLKQCKYSDIIQMKISPKNKKFGEDTNKNIYLEITQLSKELKNFFDKNYLYIFQKYYFGLKPNQNEINYEGTNIALSSKTRGLYHLLEKNKYSKKFKGIINDVYFTDTNFLIDKKFVTKYLFNC